MNSTIRPVFVVSLPRSGSTLLQRFLDGADGVSTCAEPWFLLPLVMMDHPSHIVGVYHQRIAARAIEELKDRLSRQSETWDRAVREMALTIYSDLASDDAHTFIDKTPRYYLIWERLLEIFPDATIVVLVRDPRAVMQSMINSWGGGKWNLFRFSMDLEVGFDALGAMWLSNHPRVIGLKYEDFVTSPRDAGLHLLKGLSLSGDLDEMLHHAGQTVFEGSLGDQTGIRKYDSIDSRSMANWADGFRNPLRRVWLRSWERRHAGTLAVLGYPTRASVRGTPRMHRLGSDIVRIPLGSAFGCLSFVMRYSVTDAMRRRANARQDRRPTLE